MTDHPKITDTPASQTLIAEAQRRKAALRQQALVRRAMQGNTRGRSEAIVSRLVAMPAFAAAGTVMTYVATEVEVQTHELIELAWADGKTVLVPYCADNDLHVFPLGSFAELEPGALDILEPRRALRDRRLHAALQLAIDLVLVPGVAFDRDGGRLGFGKGYYDRFLSHLPTTAETVGLAFDCQIYDEVPMLPHDVRLEKIVTESHVYEAKANA